ncbi:MAG: error-prone DNA polymerase [Pyrinomonadaceae bacterium]|nr:error-prone DNA polymerase [Pyrinomonadaceae bacterium]MBP6211870.1 error-prone DNA polymerase [Pyrinomonadaceae bacterium]
MSFIELHTRSAFSFLSSGSLPEDIAVRAGELDMPAIGMMDRDTVSGAVRFHLEAKEQGVRAMIGSEITLADGTLLPLMPIDLRGYQNMSRLITTVKLRHKKGEHFATRADIEEHAAGLLCFTGGADGFIHRSIKNRRGQEDLAWLKYTFDDRLYVELQRHHLPHEEDINQSLLGLAHKFRIPYFASNGPYYAAQRDRELFDVFTCIKNHCTIENAGRLISENSERYLKSAAQMLYQFDDYQQAVATTAEIASRVKFSMDELGYTFPDYPVPTGETMDSYLRKQAEKGAVWRYWALTPKVRAKLDYELNMIAKLKLAGYFLLVWDISQFCRANNILSQGRGSAANSVVCYALGITAVDPIEADLLFERFLSEERTEYPDIDIDLPSGEDREKVIQHVYQKYGERGAGMTANVISYRGRSAAREVGKVFGFDEDALKRLSKIIPHYGTHTRAEMMARFIEAGFDPKENYRIAKYMEMYARVLDYPRHLGQHSGGMVISLGRLDGVVPLEPASMENRNIIQWDKDDCERLGIVKVDLLGLGMMAVIRDTLTLIEEHRGEKVDLGKISKKDPLVYKTLQEADTIGMFQVESRAQINFLPKSRPETFYDIVVQVAIIRPGPIVGKMLSGYIARRMGKEEVDYMHPSFEPILKRTLGVPLFQEQLLRMAMTIAGFTGGEAEELRRALGFKRADKRLAKIETRLRSGMADKNITQETQDKIVKSILAFANYGFPESHAASFALLTYASAYLKVHYLAEFTTAMLNNYPLGFYSPATLIKDAQRHGLHFNAININASQRLFTIEDGKVLIGLKYVKGLRKDVANEIVARRTAGCQPAIVPADPVRTGSGSDWVPAIVPYTSVEDLVRRVPAINKKEIRALSLSGALNFDSTVHRRQALWESELAIQPAGELFANIEEKQPIPSFINQMSKWQLMETDLMTTGITIGKHPMAFLREELTKHGVIAAYQTTHLKKRDVVTVAGAVIVRQRPSTANDVVFITMEDETGYSNFIVMPDVFDKFRSTIVSSDFLLIRGIAEEGGMIKALFFEPINAFISKIVSHDFQ